MNPNALFLNLTEECNSKCITCNLWKRKDICNLDSKYWTKAVREFAELRRNEKAYVKISGGEPLLKYDIVLDIVKECKNQNLISIIHTNGAALSKKRVLELEEAGLSIMRFSMNSHIEKIHDNTRGVPGSLKHILNMISFIQEKNLNMQIFVNSILADFNKNHFIDMMNYLQNLNINGFTYNIIQNEGLDIKDFDLPDAKFENKQELQKVVQYIIDNYKSYPFMRTPIYILEEQLNYILHQENFKLNRECHGCDNNIIILHHGKIENCYFINTIIPQNNIGNIKKDSLLTLYKKSHFSNVLRRKMKNCRKWCGILDCNYLII